MYSEYGELMKFALETYKNKNGMKLLLEFEAVKTGSDDDEKKFKEQLKESMKSFMTSPNACLLYTSIYEISEEEIYLMCERKMERLKERMDTANDEIKWYRKSRNDTW